MRISNASARVVATTALALMGATTAAPAAYLATLSLAAARRSLKTSADQPETSRTEHPPRLVVLVPAHNEGEMIGRCLESLRAQDYRPDCFTVVVIADNCTDDTADVAAKFGACVLERHDPTSPGKGRALRWVMDGLLESHPDFDAFVVVDADSVTDPGMLAALAAAHARGAPVVQADYEALVDGDDQRSQLRAAAFLLFHRVRFSGKARLGLPCGLVGNGMLFGRNLIERHPWSAFSEVEDLEYTVHLRRSGVGPVFAPDARLVAPVVSTGPGAQVQRRRWEGGRRRVTRQQLPSVLRAIVREGRVDLWDLAADLAVPPLGILAAGTATGSLITLSLSLRRVVGLGAAAPWIFAAIGLSVHVIVGLKAGDAPPTMRRALTAAPSLVASETTARISSLRRPRGFVWERTPRAAEVRRAQT